MDSTTTALLTGPLLLGYIFNSFLYGIELLQFYRYRVSFPNDRAFTRGLVYTVVVLDTLQTGFTIHDAWTLLGAGWGNRTLLTQRNWTFGSVPFFTGIVALLVQGFYAYRAYKLIQSKFTKWMVALILFIAVTQSMCGIFAGISYVFEARVIDKRVLAWVTTIWLGGTALCDLIITTTIVTFLMIKLAGFTPTDNVVSKVIRMTVEIGAITTTAATADLILFLAFPSNNLHMMFCIPLAKLYSNCLLAMLNARNGSFAQSNLSSKDQLPTSVRQTKQGEKGQPQPSSPRTSPSASRSTYSVHSRISDDFDFSLTPKPNAIGLMERGKADNIGINRDSHMSMRHTHKQSSSFPIPPRPPQSILGAEFVSPHRRTESQVRLIAPSQATSVALQRPSKLQANADFDNLYPSKFDSTFDSHLDLSNDAEKKPSFRTRLFGGFQKN